jgi:hypothetical protein
MHSPIVAVISTAGRNLPGCGEPAQENSKDKKPNSNVLTLKAKAPDDNSVSNKGNLGIWNFSLGIFNEADLSPPSHGAGSPGRADSFFYANYHTSYTHFVPDIAPHDIGAASYPHKSAITVPL